MKQLNKVQSFIFLIGGLLMVIGAGCYAFVWQQGIACWIYLLGTIMFATMQIMQSYEGRNHTIHRLKKIMTTADMFFFISGLFMVDSAYKLLMPLIGNYVTYYQYIYNKWVLLLLVAAILEIYTMHRISHELKKDEEKVFENNLNEPK